MESSPLNHEATKTDPDNIPEILVDEQTPLIQRITSIDNDLAVNQQKGHPTRPKPSYWYAVLPLFAAVFTGAGALAPAVDLMSRVICDRYYDSQTDADSSNLDIPIQNCLIPEIQSRVASLQAVYHFLVYGSTLVVVSYFGHISDIKGRVLVFRSSLFGGLLLFITFVLTSRFSSVFGVGLLLLGAILRGLFGGDTGFIAAAQAYIADCTSPKERTIVFGRMMALIMCASMLGSNTSSFLIKATGNVTAPFYMGTVGLVLAILFTWYIPESVHTHVQSKADDTTFWEKLDVIRSVKTLFTIKTHNVNRIAMVLLATISGLTNIIILPPILLYAMLTLGWSAYEGGLLFGAMSFGKLIMATVVLPLINKAVVGNGHDANLVLKYDIWMARIGTFFVALEMFAIGFARSTTGLFLAVLIGSFSMFSQTSVRSLLTTLVAPADVGKVLGAISALDTIGLLIGHLGLNWLYGATVSFCPPFTFYVCGFIGLTAFVCSLFIHHQHGSTEEHHDE